MMFCLWGSSWRFIESALQDYYERRRPKDHRSGR